MGPARWSHVVATAGVVVVLVALRTNVSLLDLINWTIQASTKFCTFYAGVDDKPAAAELYPELAAMEADFTALREEVVALTVHGRSRLVPTMQTTYNNMFLNVVSEDRGQPRWYHPLATRLWRLVYGKHLDIFNKIAVDEWRTLNLILHGHVIASNAALCPRLVQHLVEMSCVQTALLSFMHPGAHVPPHSDPATGVLRYHLAFIVPRQRERCFIVINGQKYVWEEGKSVIFDTVYKHEVHNTSDECRVVLFLDLHRPLTGVAALLQGVANTANRYAPGTHSVIANSGRCCASPRELTSDNINGAIE